jgi:hypothetical protein
MHPAAQNLGGGGDLQESHVKLMSNMKTVATL